MMVVVVVVIVCVCVCVCSASTAHVDETHVYGSVTDYVIPLPSRSKKYDA